MPDENLTFGPLDKKRYFEQVAQLIRARILQEHLEEGFRLPAEIELAKELKVSRSVVREALRLLDVMGYVEVRKGPRGGLFVSHLYHKPIRDSLRHLTTDGHITTDNIFEVRLQIEPYIAAEAAKNAKKGDLKRLSQLMKDASSHMEDAAYLKNKDWEFHLLLADASGNPVLSILMRSLIEILKEMATDFLDPSFEKRLFQLHKSIFDTIAQKKAGEVKTLVRKDIQFVKKNFEKFLRKESRNA